MDCIRCSNETAIGGTSALAKYGRKCIDSARSVLHKAGDETDTKAKAAWLASHPARPKGPQSKAARAAEAPPARQPSPLDVQPPAPPTPARVAVCDPHDGWTSGKSAMDRALDEGMNWEVEAPVVLPTSLPAPLVGYVDTLLEVIKAHRPSWWRRRALVASAAEPYCNAWVEPWPFEVETLGPVGGTP